jgi:hypothetical protein
MVSMLIWLTVFTIALVVTVLTAAFDNHQLHLAVSGMVSLGIAIVGVQSYRTLAKNGANRSALAASTARSVGLAWIWAALALVLTYQFILQWREAIAFTIGLSIVGGLCFGLSVMFRKDAEAGHEDEAMLKFARILNVIVMVGMAITMIGLVADGKFVFIKSVTRADWAANNIFFFGAFAVACLSAHAMIAEDKMGTVAKE